MIVIVDAVRTAMGGFQGSLSTCSAPDLGSGMKAVMQAADAIKAGSAQIVVAGGMESMSNAPYLLEKARAGYRMGHGKTTDHMFQEGLEDAETGLSMGVLAQSMADQKGYRREQQDA